MEKFGNFGNSAVYVIDKSFRVQYVNDTTRLAFPYLRCGDYCYRGCCNEDKACKGCPAISRDKSDGIFYNRVLGSWVEVNCASIEWPGSGPCTMVMSKLIKDEKYTQSLTREYEVDLLTGLYKREAFFREAQNYLDARDSASCCLMALDIEHFKLFNEWYGQDAGDHFLISIGEHLRQITAGVAGYMGGDDFCVVLPNETELLSSIQETIMAEARQYGGNAGFMPAFGLYAIDKEEQLPINTIYDRAALAVASVKGNYARRVSWYDRQMIEAIEEDYVLLSEVERALREGEFLFYLQPRCNMSNGKIIGFESLARWQHPERGIVMPGEFIPVLEKNGFITKLDQHIWEMVCAQLRRWMDAGLRPLPITVNVSRVDIYTLDVVRFFCELVEKYRIEPEYLEIEITESAYVKEYQLIAGVVEGLRNAGFLVLMDDFGSGYSSLNMLKDVNVDVIKLDMKFLSMSEQSIGKGMGILDAITSMARLMGLSMIAEGVETKEQMDFLIDMGCVCGQGYYFYRPMKVDACEQLLLDAENLEYTNIKEQNVNRLKVKELLNQDLFSEVTINQILGALGVYDVCQGQIELVNVNEQFCRLIGFDPFCQAETPRRQDVIVREDVDTMLQAFKRACQEPLYGAEVDVRFRDWKGSIIPVHLRLFYMTEQDGHQLYCGAVSELSEPWNSEHWNYHKLLERKWFQGVEIV